MEMRSLNIDQGTARGVLRDKWAPFCDTLMALRSEKKDLVSETFYALEWPSFDPVGWATWPEYKAYLYEHKHLVRVTARFYGTETTCYANDWPQKALVREKLKFHKRFTNGVNIGKVKLKSTWGVD